MEAALRQVLCEMQAYSERPVGLEAERQFVDSFANSNNITLRAPMSDLTEKTLIEKVTLAFYRDNPVEGSLEDVNVEAAIRTVLEEIIHLNGDKPDPASKEYERWKANDLMAKMIAQDNNIKLGVSNE